MADLHTRVEGRQPDTGGRISAAVIVGLWLAVAAVGTGWLIG